MGKKVKKKSRTPQKEKRVATNSQKKLTEPSSPSVETVDDGVSEVKEKKCCPHLDKVIDLDALSRKIAASGRVRCEDCREGAADRRGGRGKGKHGRKKGNASAEPESKAIWVCLKCGHYACGGVGLPTSAQCHAVRHTRLTRHPIVIQFEKPQLQWCFPCNTLFQAKAAEDNAEHKDAFADVVKLMKGRTTEGSAVNAEDVWFGSGSVTTEIKSVAAVSNDLNGQGGYVASGLVNLGNTCFFNSVLQNILAMDKLRNYFFKLDVTVGPLTMSLKKLFAETNAGSKSVINPRAVFGCVSSKAPQFRGYQQHDSHELLRCLLDGLSSEELGKRKQLNSSKENGNSYSPGPTFVDAVFGGQVASTICCAECGHSSTVYEPFLDLSLPVPTKKHVSKKPQQAFRGKKPKVPPKRGGKTRPKLNPRVESVSAASSSREFSCQSQFASVGPATVAEENVVEQNSGPVEKSKNTQVFEDAAEQTSASVDDSTWLDYLEPETPSVDYSLPSNDAVESIIQDVGNEDISKNDVQAPEYSEQLLPPNEEPDIKPPQFSTINPWEDEVPLQVQSSEVLLLPYKEESYDAVEFGEGEASSLIHGGSQEDFDGFGGLFDEPDVSTAPVMGPSMSTEITETGFMAGNGSESDPDEVDDTNSPVSVETCLTHFTKPELLSNENAWHCENCSKTLLRQKLEANKQLKAASKTLGNGCGTKSQSDLVNLNKDPCPAEVGNNNGNNNDNFQSVADSDKCESVNCSSKNHMAEENGQPDEMDPFVSHGEEGKVAMKDEQSNSSGSYYTCRQESLSDQAIDSSCADDPGSTGSINEAAQQGESKLLTRKDESEESEDNEIYPEIAKVKRDATKRVLINKSPPILTIHLKRFSQDARGRLSKLNGHVAFRETIDLKPYMDPRCIDDDETYVYHLIGVVEHSGTMRGGHYVAYVRGGGKNDGKENGGGSTWFHLSDAYMHEANLNEVLGCEAYILFYEKV